MQMHCNEIYIITSQYIQSISNIVFGFDWTLVNPNRVFASSLQRFGPSRHGNLVDYKTNFLPTGNCTLKSVFMGEEGATCTDVGGVECVLQHDTTKSVDEYQQNLLTAEENRSY
jgi:hypothetical protein